MADSSVDFKKELRKIIQNRLEKQIAGQPTLRKLTLDAHALQKARNETQNTLGTQVKSLVGIQSLELSAFLDSMVRLIEIEAECKEVLEKQKAALNEAALGIGLIAGLYMGIGMTWEEVEGIMADPYWLGLADSLHKEMPPADP